MKMFEKLKIPMGFLTRLRRNQAGNTLAIVAAALFPLAGMIGSGLDISRGYLAKTRLQQACDAGVLAGRKVMGSTGVLSTNVRDEVRKYVSFNYPNNYLDSTLATTSINPTLGTNDTISLTLSTTVPTVIMRLFLKDTMPISVSCTARNDYTNIDIVLVLDTTGSMACKPERSDSSCSSWINNWFSPRSGKTMTVDGKTVTYVQEETSGGTNISRMQGLRNALDSLQGQMANIETQFNAAASGSRKRVRWAIVPFSQMVNAGFSRGTAGTTLYSRNPSWFNTTWTYYDSGTLNSNIAHNSTWLTNTWDGCVEERRTSNSITSESSYIIPVSPASGSLPSNTFDLAVETAATSSDTRWPVADPDKASGQYACPKAMRELQQLTTAQFDDYFAFNRGFVANGGTYLDLGMLWAARLLSRNGIWSADNPVTYNTFPVSRYVIFMTDGEMDTGTTSYAAYPQESYWKKTASDGSATTANANHKKRLAMICTAIKNMDVKIYAISFGSGSTLSSDLTDCSSGDGFAYKADDSDQLDAVFRDIGENIGSLRLSQ